MNHEASKNLFYFWRYHFYLFLMITSSFFYDRAVLQGVELDNFSKTLVVAFVIFAIVGLSGLFASLPYFLGRLLNYFNGKSYLHYFVILFYIFIIFSLLFDRFVFQLFHYHINFLLLQLFLQEGGFRGVGLTNIEWFTFFSIICFILALEYGLWKCVCGKTRTATTQTLWLTSTLGSLIISYFMLLISATDPSIVPMQLIRDHLIAQNAQNLPFYHAPLQLILPADAALERLPIYTRCISVRNPNDDKTPFYYPKHPLQYAKTAAAPSNKPNILFVLIDAWRFDRLTETHMPHLFNFAKQAIRFTNHWSGGNATQPGIFTLFYGIPSTYWNASIYHKRRPVLMQQLENNGYDFKILGSAPITSPPFTRNVYLNIPHLTKTEGETPYQRDLSITQKFIDSLDTRSTSPFFAVLFYDAAHSFCTGEDIPVVFKPIAHYCSRLLLNNDTDPTRYRNRQDNGYHAIDKMIARILQTLAQKHLLENTIIIFTGDHGEEFNETHNNFWGHGSNYTRYQMQVPLLVYLPKKFRALNQHGLMQYDYFTSHYDIVPTLMHDILHCKNALSDYSIGKNLWDENHPPEIFPAGSYVDRAFLFKDQILTIYPAGYYHAFDRNYQQKDKKPVDTTLVKKAFALEKHFGA